LAQSRAFRYSRRAAPDATAMPSRSGPLPRWW
jgi:hypothetical protein